MITDAYYNNCYIHNVRMNSARQKIQKMTSNVPSNIHRNTSQKSIVSKVLSTARPAVSPSASRKERESSSSVLSKERSSSIKSKSSFKSYVGKQEGKSSKETLKDSRKQNVNPNVNNPKGSNVQKGRTVKQVRLGISKPQNNANKVQQNTAKNNSSLKKAIVKESSNSSPSPQSMLKYIPQSIVEDYKKASLEDFTILRQTAQLQYSNEYLALHKRLGLVCTLKKFSKNQIADLDLAQQLAESIKIHLYLAQNNIGNAIQKIFMVFNDTNSVYLVLEPVIGSITKQAVSLKQEQKIGKYHKIVESLSQLHSHRVIIRNISNSSIKQCLGIHKITNIINAATFSLKKRRQSFMGNLSEAPHEVAIGSEYDSSYDMWSLGIFFYRIITGLSPFQGEYSMTQIKNLEYSLPISISQSLSGLISGLLCERQKRWSVAECLNCDIFTVFAKQGEMVCREVHLFWCVQ